MVGFVIKIAKNDVKWRKYEKLDMFCHNYHLSDMKMEANFFDVDFRFIVLSHGR